MKYAHLLQREIWIGDHRPWRTLLDEPLRGQAREAVLYVAKCMQDPQEVQRIVLQTRKQSSALVSWDYSSPTAATQLALFYDTVARSFPTCQWDITAQCYLKLMAANSQRYGLRSLSLFGGVGGVAFVIQQCSANGQRYHQTLAHLHGSLAEQVRNYSYWHPPLEAGRSEAIFDLISGVAGILGYLVSVSSPDLYVTEALHVLLDYLLALAKPGQPLGEEYWLSLPPHFSTERDRRLYPCGRFNCGLAHGIAGPLAALSLTMLAGYDRPGLRESIHYISGWLLQHQIKDAWGITWPTVIPYERAASAEQWSTLPASRTAWCYGSPGIARSLWLAGLALQDKHLMEAALEAIKAVLRRPIPARQIDAPTLCHGVAGLLLICIHFAQESQDSWLLEQIPLLVEQILAQFDPQSPLGFRDIESDGTLVNQPAFLTGASGTALALLAAASDVAPSWDRLLLLS